MISTFNQLLMNKYNYIMEYVNDIYLYWNNDAYIGTLELRLILAAYYRSIPCFYKIVYVFVLYLYMFMPYIYMKRILTEQHDWDTFTTLIILE